MLTNALSLTCGPHSTPRPRRPVCKGEAESPGPIWTASSPGSGLTHTRQEDLEAGCRARWVGGGTSRAADQSETGTAAGPWAPRLWVATSVVVAGSGLLRKGHALDPEGPAGLPVSFMGLLQVRGHPQYPPSLPAQCWLGMAWPRGVWHVSAPCTQLLVWEGPVLREPLSAERGQRVLGLPAPPPTPPPLAGRELGALRPGSVRLTMDSGGQPAAVPLLPSGHRLLRCCAAHSGWVAARTVAVPCKPGGLIGSWPF